jgi:acyl-coenzyme A synthetase/AMP-(fatty) acid ligase
MASLGFDLLDRHVIGGGADDPATATLTYARLLERSSFLASGLRMLGVQPGDDVGVQVDGDDRVVVVCACVRLGALPADDGSVVVAVGADGPEVRSADGTHPLDLVRQAGSGDAATALAADADGYRDAVLERAADVVEPLLARRPVG